MDFPKSVSNDVPESASTTDLQFQFKEHIDFKPQALQDQVRKRSSSVPPKGALASAEPDAASKQEFDNQDLASLIKRSAPIYRPAAMPPTPQDI